VYFNLHLLRSFKKKNQKNGGIFTSKRGVSEKHHGGMVRGVKKKFDDRFLIQKRWHGDLKEPGKRLCRYVVFPKNFEKQPP